MRKPRPPESGFLGMFDEKKPRGSTTKIAKERRKKKEEKLEAQWQQVHLTLTHKHVKFLKNAKLGKERLGPHTKQTEMIRAFIEAVALSRIDLRKVKSRKELRELLRYYLNRGKDRDSEFVFASLSDALYDRVHAYANSIGRTVEETIMAFVENQLTYATLPTQYIRLPDKPKRRWSGPRSRALKVDNTWYRNDVGRWEIEIDINRVHFRHFSEYRLNARGWETFRRSCVISMSEDRCLLQVEREFLLRKGDRFVHLRLDRILGQQMHYYMHAHRAKKCSGIKELLDYLASLEAVPVWDRSKAEKYMSDYEGPTVFRLPGLVSFPKRIPGAVEGDHFHRNHILEALICKGLVVLRVEYTPPIRTYRRRGTPDKQQLKKLLKR